MAALTRITRLSHYAPDCVVGICVTRCHLEWPDLPRRQVTLKKEGCECVFSLC